MNTKGTDAFKEPILIEVLQNAFVLIAEEMGIALQRTAYSTNIKDRLDFSCALYTKDGGLVAQAEHIPLHLGQLSWGIKNLLARLPGRTLERGSIYLTNDTAITGAHFPDLLMAKAVYRDDVLIGIVANLAHHVDVGGFAPGSLYSGATEAFQEGIRIPPVRIMQTGQLNEEILNFFLSNTRTERENRGDCMAQIAALNAGERKLGDLAQRYGAQNLVVYMRQLIAHTERRLRAAMARLPTASGSFVDYIEGDGNSSARIPIRVKVDMAPGKMKFDFTGTNPQVAGPINATRPFTLACVAFSVKAILDPLLASNEGMFAPLEVFTPPGSIVDATFPAAMSNNSSILGLRIVDTIFGAIADIFPKQITAASSGTMNVITIGGYDVRNHERFAYIESYGGGQGGADGADGMDAVHTNTSNTRNAPAEVIERYYPLRILRYGLVEGSGGAGEFRGGLGLVREYEFEADATTFSLVSDRREMRPWGLFGGLPGGVAKCTLTHPDGSTEILPSKVTRTANRGSRLMLATAGGGGYGKPDRRDQTSIEEDLENGLANAEHYRKSPVRGSKRKVPEPRKKRSVARTRDRSKTAKGRKRSW